MKKLIKVLLVVGLLVSTVTAKGVKIFDLKEQYFSGTMIKKGQEGFGQENRYKLEKVIVTTDTKFNEGSYMHGLFTVDVKEPLANWNVNIKKKNGTDSSGEMTTIRVTSDSGVSYFISFNAESQDNKDYIQINNKNIITKKIQKQKLTVSVSKKNNMVLFSINGKAFLKKDAKTFGNLVKVEIELNDNRYWDELFALDIYEIK